MKPAVVATHDVMQTIKRLQEQKTDRKEGQEMIREIAVRAKHRGVLQIPGLGGKVDAKG